jgi:hypothetical protein
MTDKTDSKSMNENRLVTLILVVVFILWAAGLAGTYYVRSHHRHGEGPSTMERHARDTLSAQHAKTPPSPEVPAHTKIAIPIKKIQKKGFHANENQVQRNPAPALSAIEPHKERPKGEPAASPLTPPAPKSIIQETTKANGSFARAQHITEGVIIGMRGSEGDRADFYKVQADGRRMVIRLEATRAIKSQYFTVAIYDAGKKRVGEDVGKARESTAIMVKPQAVYYLKVDLTHAPIQSSNYTVHVNFRNPDLS